MTFRLVLVLGKRSVLVMYVILLLASVSYHMRVSSVEPHCHRICYKTRGCFARLGSTTIQRKIRTLFLVRPPPLRGFVTIGGHQEFFVNLNASDATL
jgi:hypothetical protein